jgi:tetratricopeptide (TPR) repeat protein
MMSALSDTVVSDGSSPVFVAELIKELKVPGATIEQVLNRTRMDVSRDTKAQQVPSFSSALVEDFALGSEPPSNPNPKTADAKPVDKPTNSESDLEAQARHDYVVAESDGTKQSWNDFIAKHPSGYYSDLARQQIAKLTPDTATKSSSPADAAAVDLAGYYRRGQLNAMKGDYAKAISDFTEVIRLDPKHAGALNDRCWVRAITGDLGSALKDCNEALRVAPNYADALDSRGLINLKAGLLPQAVADYDAALERDPKHASSLYGRGIAKMRNGDVDAGKRDIDAAKAIQATIADEFAGYGVR